MIYFCLTKLVPIGRYPWYYLLQSRLVWAPRCRAVMFVVRSWHWPHLDHLEAFHTHTHPSLEWEDSGWGQGWKSWGSPGIFLSLCGLSNLEANMLAQGPQMSFLLRFVSEIMPCAFCHISLLRVARPTQAPVRWGGNKLHLLVRK